MTPSRSETDGRLLLAFIKEQDQAAFAAVVERHAAMVLTVCRRFLDVRADAEDAAQAVFATLARKAAALTGNDSVAAWLHHVAYCLAVNAFKANAARRAREQKAMAEMTAPRETGTSRVDELKLIVVRELNALPEKYRQALVLFHLEGASLEETASQCGTSVGTVGSRLSRGRELLRRRLVSQGAAVSLTALGGLLASDAGPAVVPAGFVGAAANAAAGGVLPAKVAALTKSALQTLFWAKVKTAAAAVVLTAGVVAGGGLAAHQALAYRAVPVTAAGLKPLSPWEAWTKELLARAAAGPGEALDLGTCRARDENGQWFIENRVSADRRIWVTGLRGHSRVYFAKPRCQRGVLVGQMQLVAADPPPAGATRVPVRERDEQAPRFPGVPADSASGYGVFLHGDAKDQWPLRGSDLVPVAVGSGGRDAERFVVYFETNANGQVEALYAVQPVGREPLPAFGGLSHTLPGAQATGVGIGLFAGSTSVVWQGLKVVPLGPELRAPPFGTPRRKPQTNDQGDRP